MRLERLFRPATRLLVQPPPGMERLRTRLLVLAFWCLIGALETTKEYTGALLDQQSRSLDDTILINFPYWYFWVFGTVIIGALADRWPLEGGGASARNVLRHAGVGLLLSVVHLSLVGMFVYYAIARGSDMLGADMAVEVQFWLRGYVVIDFLTYWMVLGAYHALLYHRRYLAGSLREAEARAHASDLEAAAVSARLHSLQMELNPHFLFNSLNAVAALVDEDRKSEATAAISQLARLLRLTLHRGREHELEVDRELEFIELYMDLERIRFGPRLQVDITAERDIGDALVPPMILQPLIENAVKHGAARIAGRVSIQIDICRGSNDTLILTVCDDGPGLRTSPDGIGTGLANVRERLRTLYGGDALLILRNRRDGRGTTAQIRMPLRMEAVVHHSVGAVT